mmetsp:Transcript_70495/g.168849  ORF Transcript_70495/g.168849 Transcript_70495/m.168849 type:complete len:474 (-) Transcript_70495:103-1524(-)|eukprot:CAMPEP_0178431746 /NCGR_PEP_ID=MMETSP0689_2-20121128/32020_1 /TAXON_ID=160604 /ORGANISM="Amphidinium massartii, Strain CS-259" /LENGTH=473 /DNA_ID=CAMNT_0020053695 /DNA_START=21 /DNA_END=1442 /DNA_ORIENTATION=+
MSHRGTVKSFAPRDQEAKKGGYGFIVCPQVEGDVWFCNRDMAADLLEACENRILTLKDREVTFDIQQKEDGAPGKPQALGVKLFAALNEKMPGKVRSFNSMKGFGFFTCSALEGQDVYFSKKELPPAQQMLPVQTGTTASFTLTQLEDGKLQAKDVQLVFNMAAMAGMLQQSGLVGAMGGGGMSYGGKGGMSDMGMGMYGGCQGGMGGMGMGMGMSGGSNMTERAGLQGVVSRFLPDKGFGFISCPAVPGADIYFKGMGAQIEPGTKVTFTLVHTSDGKPQAKNIGAGLQEGQLFEGVVRSYVSKTGYGFITVNDGNMDVYFKGTSVPAMYADDDSDYVGRQVRFTCTVTKDGKPQVSEIQWMGESRGSKRPGEDDGLQLASAGPAMWNASKKPRQGPPTVYGPQLYGSVKSYNADKGFGFIFTPATGGDVFFLRTSLPPEHQQSKALAGSPVQFYMAQAQDGRQQADQISFS